MSSTRFSANVSGHKYSTSFSQTYNLLSNYLKDQKKRSAVQGLNRDPTMDLFPQQAAGTLFGSDVSVEATSKAGATPSSAQMTIFYNGQVIVIDDLCPGKAEEILQLASHRQRTGCISKPCSSIEHVLGLADTGDHNGNMIKDNCDNDMPIARSGSLRRFFEKRRDRSAARAAAPYSLIGSGDHIVVPKSMMTSTLTDQAHRRDDRMQQQQQPSLELRV